MTLTVSNVCSIRKWAGPVLLFLLLAGSWAGSLAPAAAQIPTSSTTTTRPQPSTTSTTRQTTTTRPIVTTSTTRPSTTTSSGSTTSTTGGETTTTSRGSTTSTGSTETTETTEETTPAFTIPTPTSQAPAEDAPDLSPGSADISAVFPWLSLIGFGAAAALAGTRWYQTRPEAGDPPAD